MLGGFGVIAVFCCALGFDFVWFGFGHFGAAVGDSRWVGLMFSGFVGSVLSLVSVCVMFSDWFVGCGLWVMFYCGFSYEWYNIVFVC